MRGYGEGFRRPRCGSSGEAKGERERCPGLFIGTVRYRNGQELKELKRGGRGYCAEETVTGVVNARKKRTDRWDQFVSGEREERRYLFGEKTS
jgi:hypothetical protein